MRLYCFLLPSLSTTPRWYLTLSSLGSLLSSVCLFLHLFHLRTSHIRRFFSSSFLIDFIYASVKEEAMSCRNDSYHLSSLIIIILLLLLYVYYYYTIIIIILFISSLYSSATLPSTSPGFSYQSQYVFKSSVLTCLTHHS
jgi:hypothetical protein